MTRQLPFLLIAVLCGALGGPATPARAQLALFVNTTEHMAPNPAQCLPGEVCTLQGAIDKAEGRNGLVTACFDTEDERCLSVEDPGYDPATGKWTINYAEKFEFILLNQGGTEIDFSRFDDDWDSPADNKVVLSAGPEPAKHFFKVTSSGNMFGGFDLSGTYEISALYLSPSGDGTSGIGASVNQVGPGLVLADITLGAGIQIGGAGTSENRVVGIWCGFRGHDAALAPVQEDCIRIENGATLNVVGGPEEADRNVLSGSRLGAGVHLRDPGTKDNRIEGNYMGVDPSGMRAIPNLNGVNIGNQAANTTIVGNLLSGNENDGIVISDGSTPFGRLTMHIEENRIGTDATGEGAVPNHGCGVRIKGLSKDIVIASNQIWYNKVCGVTIIDGQARNNTISRNSATANNNDAILVVRGANDGVEPPELTIIKNDSVRGLACPDCLVEIFSDPAEEAEVFEGDVVAEANGSFEFVKPAGFTYRMITATQTDGRNTSSLSLARVAPRATLTPTPTGGGPTPTPRSTARPTPTYGLWTRTFLPFTARGARR